MTAGIENEQKAKDAFKLSSFIGKEASISTNNQKKKKDLTKKESFSEMSQWMVSLESKIGFSL